jgi:hypothetical protein
MKDAATSVIDDVLEYLRNKHYSNNNNNYSNNSNNKNNILLELSKVFGCTEINYFLASYTLMELGVSL